MLIDGAAKPSQLKRPTLWRFVAQGLKMSNRQYLEPGLREFRRFVKDASFSCDV